MPLNQICRWHHDVVGHLLLDDDWLDGARSIDSAATNGVRAWRSRLRLLVDDRAIYCCASNWLHLRLVSTRTLHGASKRRVVVQVKKLWRARKVQIVFL